MGAMLRLYDTHEPAGTRPMQVRKAPRHKVEARIEAESSSGEVEEVDLRDISAFGCNIAAKADWVRLGKFVTLTLGKARRIEAVVRWTRDGTAGLEFLRPIPFRDAEIISGFIEE